MRERLAAGSSRGRLLLFIAVVGLSLDAAPAWAQSCAPLPEGVISWWPGQGDAMDIIDGNPGALSGDAAFGTGLVGQAFGFSCGSGRVTVPDAENLNFGPTSPMSVELWMFRTGSTPLQHILGKRGGCGPSGIHYQLAFDTDPGLTFGSFDGGVSTGVSPPLFTWVHVAATFDGTTFSLYVDGALAGTGTGTLGPANTAPFLIGASGDCAPFIGLVDEASLYNRALSAEEVQAIFNAGAAGKCLPSAPGTAANAGR